MKKIAWIFPGQGAQYPGMAKDFAANYSEARETFEEAEDVLKYSLASLVFEGPEGELQKTHNSQVAIFVASTAILRVLRKLFPSMCPEICGGLSLGEYTALTAAEYLSFADNLILVQKRGQFMSEACEKTKGTMAALIGLDAQLIQELIDELNLPEDLWVANFNCPGQTVLSGTEKGVAMGIEAAKRKGARRAIPLSVHGAFHSGLMRPAERRLAPFIRQVPMDHSEIPLVMNASGTIVSDEAQIRDNLIKQVTYSVLWEQSIQVMASRGVELFVEIGPGKALSGMVRKTHPAAEVLSISAVDDINKWESIF